MASEGMKSKILRLPMVESGDEFRATDVAKALAIHPDYAKGLLYDLKIDGKVSVCQRGFRKQTDRSKLNWLTTPIRSHTDDQLGIPARFRRNRSGIKWIR